MRKQVKRVGATALSMTLVFGSIAGCGKKDAEPTAEVTTLAADTANDTSAEPKETEGVTTAAPATTAEPTTAEPTTAEPTTAESTTAEPTTAEPTTEVELPALDPDLTPSEAFSELEQMILEFRIGNNYYEAVSTMAHPEDYGFTPDKLTDYRVATYNISEMQAKVKIEKQLQAMLKSIDYEGLTDAQKLAYDKHSYDFDIEIRMSEQANLVSPIATNGDIRNGLFSFCAALDDLTLRTEEDLIGYQKILESVPVTLQEAIDYMHYQLDEYGYYQLPSNIRSAVDSAVYYARTDPEENPLVEIFEGKVRAMDLSDEKKEEYISKHNAYVTGDLSNALMKFTRDLQKLNSSSNKTKGLCQYEGGAEYYDVMLRKLLGVEMTPQEIFDYIEARMIGQASLAGIYKEAFPEDYEIYLDGSYEVPYDYLSIEEIAAYYTKAMAQDYPMELLPAYKIEELSELFRSSSANAYYYPALWGDDSPVMIRYNPDMRNIEYDLDNVLVHEGFGGHMLQFACAAPEGDVTSLTYHKAYTEGWAEYVQCESFKYAGLSTALVTFRKSDCTFGQDLMALANIGVNGLGWSKEEMEDYLVKFGLTRYNAGLFYDEVIADPSRSLPYAFGEKKTRELIEEYKKIHADDLDVKEMHRKYMSIGATSFDIVEKYFLGE
ncbi:MAG: DUF885 family protein [Lachnospiraceae bacterium]|nr:DUF885 family protein [Lachnospiraceae bacterium]